MASLIGQNIKAIYAYSNTAYDIYKVYGVENAEEDNGVVYHEELRGFGTTEEDVENQYKN